METILGLLILNSASICLLYLAWVRKDIGCLLVGSIVPALFIWFAIAGNI